MDRPLTKIRDGRSIIPTKERLEEWALLCRKNHTKFGISFKRKKKKRDEILNFLLVPKREPTRPNQTPIWKHDNYSMEGSVRDQKENVT